MFQLKNMTAEDFEFAVRITDTMDWKLTDEDFQFMLKLEPQGCFVLLDDSKRAGIVTTISFGKMGWLGNLIVTEDHRKKGAGTTLVKQAIKYLTSEKVETIGLYSYIEKIPFYKRLGFEYDSEFTFLSGKGFSSQTTANLREAQEEDTQKIIKFDKTCFGESRKKLLKPILLNPNNSCYVYNENGQLIGYGAAKLYEDMAELGPSVCRRGRSDIAIELLKANLNKAEGLEVSVYVPKRESAILDMLTESGFTESFRVARMFFKPKKVKNCIYVAESLERG